MKRRIRILTYHYIKNPGASLFALALTELLRNTLPAEVRIIDHKAPRLAIYDYLKQYNIFQAVPSFYYKRARLWRRFNRSYLDLEKAPIRWGFGRNLLAKYARRADALLVGMDAWCITNSRERPAFPNIYWLPEKVNVPKIAYSVSAFDSDMALVSENAKSISAYLNDFDVIGARDKFTLELVQKHRTRAGGLVDLIPDPTFMYEIRKTGVTDKLLEAGVDPDRPMAGLLLYGKDRLSRSIRDHFHAKGYQLIAPSMYNAYADFNLGHVLDPLEWAEVFGLFSFCITDRFHGTVFCLKHQIPFVTLQKETHLPLAQSKTYDLLREFGLERCFANPHDEDFRVGRFLSRAEETEAGWGDTQMETIKQKIREQQVRHRAFIGRMKTEVGWD